MPYLVESAGKHRTNGHTPPPNGTGGRIIFVSATLHYSGTPLQSHVSVAKAGVDAMAMSVAIEQGPKGITSNIIAPGPIADTEGVARLSKSDHREKSSKGIPSGRYGTVKEIADATVYLFSDAGNYVNGETLVGKSEITRRLFNRDGLTHLCSRRRPVAHCRLWERFHIPRFLTFGRCCVWRCWRQDLEVVVNIYQHVIFKLFKSPMSELCFLLRGSTHLVPSVADVRNPIEMYHRYNHLASEHSTAFHAVHA